MKTHIFFWIGILLCLAACTAPLPVPTPTATIVPTPRPTVAKSGTFHMNFPSSPSVASVPYFIALDSLRAQGYQVETTQFARFDLIPAALLKGDLDIAPLSYQSGWPLIAKQAPIQTIVSWTGNQYMLVAQLDIKTCPDLNGQKVAHASVASVNVAMFDQYLKKNCPGTDPQRLIIDSATNRTAALLSGQVVGAVVETDDWNRINAQAPGRFHIISSFYKEFPLVEIGGYFVHKDFATAHPEMVKDFIRALLTAHRLVQDKQILREGVTKYLANDATALAAVDVYVTSNVWDVNGGLTKDSVQRTFDFLVSTKAIPAELKAEQVVDLTYLNTVLAEMGRK